MAQNLNLGFRLNESPEILLKELILSPLIYIRFLGILCSIVVFGCISDQVQEEILNRNVCNYNGSNACSYGVAVGVIAFLLCLAFLVRDVMYVVIDFQNNLLAKQVILVVDAAVNGLWTFMWFVAFVYLADQWRKTNKSGISTSVKNCANSGVAFSFFCIFIWAGIVGVNIFYFARLMRGGGAGLGGGGGGGGGGRGGGGYASFPEGGSTDEASDREGGGGGKNYQPPEY